MSETPETRTYRISIRRPVTMAMIFLTLIVFGWKSYRELPINLMPDISYPTLTVRTEYEGAAPEDVEELITRPLEERLSVVSGVVEISSISSAGLAELIMEFTWDTDMDLAIQDVRESLDSFQPPQGVTKNPIILRYDPTLDPVMRVAISGSDVSQIADYAERQRRLQRDLLEIREAAERELKSDLEAEEGIAQVIVKGGREEEIQILLDSERLKNLGLSPRAVVDAVNQQNVNLSGGKLKEGKTEYLVRTMNEFQDIDEVRAVIIRTPAGDQFRLDDLATIVIGEKERKTIVRVGGQEAVELEIFKEGDANTVQVCNTLKDFFSFDRKPSFFEKMIKRAAEHAPSEQAKLMLAQFDRSEKLAKRLRSRLPTYATPTLITDQSRFIVASIREVQSTAIVGGLLALAVLFFFLRELRSTIIVGIAIPISVIATFVPMFMRDVSLNIMSLGGLALGVGMLVDNSIVVLESIFRCREEGDSVVDAAERGAQEVSGAVTASTLTTIAVFFPIIFVEGIAGQLFRDLALTVTFSLIASLLVALYLIPMIASRKGLSAVAGESTIWILKAFRSRRTREGNSFLGALVGVPATGILMARAWTRETWGETVGANLRVVGGHAISDQGDPGEGHGLIFRILATLFVPFVFILFVLQSLLKLVGGIATTFLFGIALTGLAGVWVAAKIFGGILFIPLELFSRLFNASRVFYGIFIRQALRFSPLVLLLTAAIAMHAGSRALTLGRELIPPMKQGEFGIHMQAPPGTLLVDTEERARKIETIVRAFPEVESVTVEIGAEESSSRTEEGENVALLTIKLKDPERNVPFQDEIIEEMRIRILEVSADEITFTLPTLFSFKAAVELQVYGEEHDDLKAIGENVKRAIQDVAGLKDLELSLKDGYPEIQIVFDRDLLAEKNLSPFDVGQLLRTEVQGDVATRFSRGAKKIDIRVRSEKSRLQSRQDLRNLSVLDGHPPTPLSSVASIRIERGPSEIRRIDQREVVLLTGNVEGRDLGSVAAEIRTRLDKLEWSEGTYYELGGQQRELETSYGGLLFALSLAIFLVYVVMACQFESIWHPALIMFSVPLAFIGVVYVLDWYDISLSIVVFLGGIVLAGIVVNDAIVLVDYINQLRRRGLKKIDAVVEAGKVRFRPIIMTTLTTVLGLLPMVFSTGEGAEIRQPMAMTVMAGLSSATILTLVIIPMIYNMTATRDKSEA